MTDRKVKCAKFGIELPGMARRPFAGALGERIYEHVSQDAWNLWLKEMTKIINEYRLNLAKKEHQEYLHLWMAHFFFGESAPAPLATPQVNPDIKFV